MRGGAAAIGPLKASMAPAMLPAIMGGQRQSLLLAVAIWAVDYSSGGLSS